MYYELRTEICKFVFLRELHTILSIYKLPSESFKSDQLLSRLWNYYFNIRFEKQERTRRQ
jgi:hypothetical protein